MNYFITPQTARRDKKKITHDNKFKNPPLNEHSFIEVYMQRKEGN